MSPMCSLLRFQYAISTKPSSFWPFISPLFGCSVIILPSLFFSFYFLLTPSLPHSSLPPSPHRTPNSILALQVGPYILRHASLHVLSAVESLQFHWFNRRTGIFIRVSACGKLSGKQSLPAISEASAPACSCLNCAGFAERVFVVLSVP